jgi:hypothetical protein
MPKVRRQPPDATELIRAFWRARSVRQNGLRYPRWGGDGEAVQPEKGQGVEKGLESRQNPQRRVHALFGGFMQVKFVC